MSEKRKERLLVAAIQDEFADAEGGLSDQVQQQRKAALLYYKGAPRGDETEGRSSVVAMDLASAVETNLSILRGMLIDEGDVSFERTGAEDALTAKAESDAVSDVIYKDNPGKRALMTAIKDGLLSRQSVMAIDTETMTEGDEAVTRVIVRAVPSENIAHQAAFEGELQDIRFFSEMVPYARSDLIDMGCDRKKVERLNAGEGDNATTAAVVRNAEHTDNWTASSRAADTIRTYWVYLRYDLDGDGIAERYRILYADNTVLQYEEFDLVPYALGSPFASPHRLSGESLFDKLKQVQDVMLRTK